MFASLDDPVVPYQWSVDTYDKLTSLGIPSKLTSFEGNVHVPFAEHGAEMEKQTTKFALQAARAEGRQEGLRPPPALSAIVQG